MPAPAITPAPRSNGQHVRIGINNTDNTDSADKRRCLCETTAYSDVRTELAEFFSRIRTAAAKSLAATATEYPASHYARSQAPAAQQPTVLQNPVLQRGGNPQPPPAQRSSASESASQRTALWREPGEKQRKHEQQQPRASETMEHAPRSADATSNPAPSGAHPVAQQPTPSPTATYPAAQQTTPRRLRGANTDNTDIQKLVPKCD